MGGYEANSVYGLCMGMYLEKGSVIALRVPVPHAATGCGSAGLGPTCDAEKLTPGRMVTSPYGSALWRVKDRCRAVSTGIDLQAAH